MKLTIMAKIRETRTRFLQLKRIRWQLRRPCCRGDTEQGTLPNGAYWWLNAKPLLPPSGVCSRRIGPADAMVIAVAVV